MATVDLTSGRIYTPFNFNTDVSENQEEIVTVGMWSGDSPTLSTFFTSSAETDTQKQYYYDAYQSASTAPGAEVQFSVAYGHKQGSGSVLTNENYPTKAVYSQYRLLLLEPTVETFTFNGVNSNDIYVINLQTARFKERIDVTGFQVGLGVSGSATYRTIVPDSTISTGTESSVAGTFYNLVSGSIANGVYNSGSPSYYGTIYPNLGLCVFNPAMLDASCSFGTVRTSNAAGDNAYKLFTSISASAVTAPVSGAFTARSNETIHSIHYFVRVLNSEYNFTTNPTWTTGSLGDFRFSSFVGDPRVYITTVGLYNDRYELLALAKLSQPILKTFNNEALIKIKLQF